MFNNKSHWCSTICQAEVKVRTGICDHEKTGPQTLYIEAKMYLPVTAITAPKKINDVADYDRIYKAIMALENKPHTDLLEQIIIEIAAECFADERIAAVEVCITKPEIYNGVAIPEVTLAVNKEDWVKHFQK
jgi:dihydroneopterin aldolase